MTVGRRDDGSPHLLGLEAGVLLGLLLGVEGGVVVRRLGDGGGLVGLLGLLGLSGLLGTLSLFLSLSPARGCAYVCLCTASMLHVCVCSTRFLAATILNELPRRWITLKATNSLQVSSPANR